MKSNHEFLDYYLNLPARDRIESDAILPLDKKLIQARLNETEAKLRSLADERAAINTQSGDSWHDGALNDNDHDKRIADRDLAKLRHKETSQEVDYPEEEEPRVTLGSKVALSVEGVESVLHIVGFSPVYSSIEFASLEAPVVQSIIGHQIGHTALLYLRNGNRNIKVLSLDQTALRLMDENNYAQNT